MSKLNFLPLNLPRQLLAVIYLALAFLYPGQNPLQTTVLSPGPTKNYVLGDSSFASYPTSDITPPPATSARGIIIQDAVSKTILFSRQADVSMLPASTTKIMTALVARDYWTDLQTVLTVQNEDRAIGQTIDLVRGEQLTIESLLQGLLIHSGNDAALALADNFPGGYSAFVLAMNVKARSLHLDHTVYKNPSGVEQYGHTTSPRDLATLASAVMADPVLAKIVSTRTTKISDTTGTIVHSLETTNELLGVIPGVTGLKTGWTENAGECLISYVERDGRAVVFVVLGSRDRFGDTRALIDWVFSHHTWQAPQL